MREQPIFTIRPATEADTPLILQFIRAIAEYEHLSDEVSATEQDLRAHLFREPRRAEVVFACEREEPVGFALFFHNFSTFVGKPGLYLEDLFIFPEHRGKGYGRALMIHLARVARDRGCGRFEWTVLDWNTPSIEFYRSLGAASKSEWIIQRVSGTALEELAGQPLFTAADC